MHHEETPNGDIHNWKELNDEEIDPGIREDLEDFLKIDWANSQDVMRRLREENFFAPSVWMGFTLLLESRGLTGDKKVMEKFESLSKGLNENSDLNEQLKSIHDLVNYFSSLGFNKNELSAPEILRLAYFGYADKKTDKAFEEFGKDARFKEIYERFDREARKREQGNGEH